MYVHLRRSLLSLTAGLTVALLCARAGAHCDTLDGPVVLAARTAIEKSDVTPLLRWVGPTDEAELREAFDRTMRVRPSGDEARELAELYLFETAVRLHRAGEGQPYTGLKPAGTADHAILAADESIRQGSADELIKHIQQTVNDVSRDLLADVLETAAHADDSVEAGRKYVHAYVKYMHYIEGLAAAAGGHGAEHHAAAENPHAAIDDAHAPTDEMRHAP